MNRTLTALLSAAVLLSVVTVQGAEQAATKGAKPGEWTQDYEAAVKIAKAQKLPMLLNFSGSDWCGWCKLMVKNVFSKAEWQEYAKENIMLVLIDFPKDDSLVPAEFRERNETLKDKFGVGGFPTYIVLDCDGETQVGQLGASRDATPESFIAQLSSKLKYCAGQVEKYTSKLKPEEKKEYMAIIDKMANYKSEIAETEQSIKKAEKNIEMLQEKTEQAKSDAAEFRARQKGPEELKKYKQLKSDYDQIIEELEAWFKSNPKRTKENMEKMQGMKEKIEDLQSKLSAY